MFGWLKREDLIKCFVENIYKMFIWFFDMYIMYIWLKSLLSCNRNY